ncbi:MAG: hypothetical protein ACKOC6_09665, partial [bacterium]
ASPALSDTASVAPGVAGRDEVALSAPTGVPIATGTSNEGAGACHALGALVEWWTDGGAWWAMTVPNSA